jgi:hypothetical protein
MAKNVACAAARHYGLTLQQQQALVALLSRRGTEPNHLADINAVN